MKAHLRKLILLALGVMSVAGCISQKRTPYHEIALTGEAARETDFYWPFYMGDGRAHYALWPLFKVSPGCFEAFPLYSYDHGIHDVALIATYSSKTQESRLFPLWYQNKDGWLLAPLAYHFKDQHDFATGCPFLYNHIQDGSELFVQSLLYYGELNPKSSFHLLFPLFSYYTEHEREDYSLWTLLGRRGIETNTYAGGSHVSRETWTKSSLWLYGLTHQQDWEGTKENPRETCVTDKSKMWLFPLYWNWEDHLKGERNDLLFPIFFRTIATRDAPGTWATPLFGWSADQSWWYALNCGHYQNAYWCLPFTFWDFEEADGRTRRDLWTMLGYLEKSWDDKGDNKVHAWGVGPLLPVIAHGNETSFNLLGGLLWRQRNSHPSNYKLVPASYDTTCAQCSPRNTSRRYESTEKFLLFGSLYWTETEREYELESLREERPIYWEEVSSRYGTLLWSQSKTTLHGGEHLPEGSIFPGQSGERYNLLGGLWATEKTLNQQVERYSRTEACQERHHFASRDYTKLRYESQHEAQTYGWICWHNETTTERDAEQHLYVSTYFRTPFFGLGKAYYQTNDGKTFDGGNRFSALLGLYSSTTEINYRYDHYTDEYHLDPTRKTKKSTSKEYKLLWKMLWHWEDEATLALKPETNMVDLNPETAECETEIDQEHSLLFGLLWDASDYRRSNHKHGKYRYARLKRELLCGFLYDDDYHSTQEDSYCTSEVCKRDNENPEKKYNKCSRVFKRECNTTHEQNILCGLLMAHELKDKRVYEQGEPETIKVDQYKDKLSFLFGIPYLSERERNGTVKRLSLFGILFDQRIAPSEKTSTFGILGYLYRRNRHADGTREQLIFPFIRTATNATTDTWSFSFCGRLFKVERLPDGKTEWALFWL